MEQWHTPVPIIPEPDNTLFSTMHDSDIVYQISSDAEDERISEFIGELIASSYVPKTPYKELVQRMREPPMYISHIEAFVFTAKFSELRSLGLVKHKQRLNANLIYSPTAGKIHGPQVTTIIDPYYVKSFYRCCGKSDLGCWFGPVKNEITPWEIVPHDFPVKIWTLTEADIRAALKHPIKKGTYWKTDPTVRIEELRTTLVDRFVACVSAIDPESALGMEYYLLLELTHNETLLDLEAKNLPNSKNLAVDPLSLNFPGKQFYLDTLAKKDSLLTSLDDARIWFKVDFIGPWSIRIEDDLNNLPDKVREYLKNNDVTLESHLSDMYDKVVDHERRLNILNSVKSVDSADDVELKRMATVLKRNVDVDVEKKNRFVAAATILNEDTSAYLADYERDIIIIIEDEYNGLGVVPPVEVIIAPYGNVGTQSNRFSTGNQFKWVRDSCWCDSVLSALFSISNSPWEIEIRNATKMYVKAGCIGTDFRDALVEDMVYLQSDAPIRPSKAIQYFEQCAEKPQKYGVYENANDTFTNLKSLFNLSDDIVLRDTSILNAGYTTFAAIISRPGHFIPYILQPNKRWMRLDDISSERVLYEDFPKDGPRDLKDGFGGFNRVIEKAVFYLDMRTNLWEGMTKLTAKDIFKHWETTRNRLNLIQPVYLNEDQVKIRDKGKKMDRRKIPSHNKQFYGDDLTFEDIIQSIQTGTFDYNKFPDTIENVYFPEPEDYEKKLLDIISSFDSLKTISDDDKRAYLKLLHFAVKPRYQSTVLYDPVTKVPSLVRTNDLQTYVDADKLEIMTILEYFFKEKKIQGRVMNV